MASRLTFFQTNKTPTYFQGARNPTRFDNCSDLKKSAELVEQIRAKVNELANLPQAKLAETADFDKYTVMNSLLESLDKLIIEFNSHHQQAVLKDESREVSLLINQLIDNVKPFLNDPNLRKTLETKRNNHRELARKGSDIGFIGIAAALALSSAFLVGAAACAAGWAISTATKKWFNLNDLDTASAALVKKLDEGLKEAYIKIELESRPAVNNGAAPRP
jgi:hypothetical protein